MNLFFLDADASACARYHADTHVVKMITEYGQMLSTCHRMVDGLPIETGNNRIKVRCLDGEVWDNDLKAYARLDGGVVPYKVSHYNAPHNVWLRKSRANYEALANLTLALCDEFEHRFGKEHLTGSSGLALWLACNVPVGLENGETTPPPVVIKDVDVIWPATMQESVDGYRHVYRSSKKELVSYSGGRSAPDWFNKGE